MTTGLDSLLPQLDIDAQGEVDLDQALDQPDLPATHGLNPLFDFGPDGGGYVTTEGGQALILDDSQRSLLTWVEKAIRTRRGTYPIYGPDYGTDLAQLIGQVTVSELQSVGPEDLRRALTLHPLIEDIRDVTVSRGENPDVVIIEFLLIDRLHGATPVWAMIT